MLTYAVRHEELRILRPAVKAFSEADLLLTERLAVGCGGVVPVRGTIADMTVQDDQSRAPFRLPEDLESLLDPAHVVGIADPQDVPAVTEETSGHVFRERQARVAFDGDVVVVVDPAEVVQAQVAGQGGSLGRDSLHQATVAADDINAVVEDVESWSIIALGEPLLRDRHADARGHPLAQRAGGRLDPRHPVVFGVPRRPAVELAEAADVVKGDCRLAKPFVIRVHCPGPGQVKDGPKEHGGMPIGEHEAVAVGPDRILRVEAQHVVPKCIDQGRQRHRGAGVSGVGLLHGIYGQGTDGVGRQLIQLLVGHDFPFFCWGAVCPASIGFCHPHGSDANNEARALSSMPSGRQTHRIPKKTV